MKIYYQTKSYEGEFMTLWSEVEIETSWWRRLWDWLRDW